MLARGFVVRGKRPTGAFSEPANLPPYSPDPSPIERALAKLKTVIQRAAARTGDDLWHITGHACALLTEEEHDNFFKAAGYETDRTQHALEEVTTSLDLRVSHPD